MRTDVFSDESSESSSVLSSAVAVLFDMAACVVREEEETGDLRVCPASFLLVTGPGAGWRNAFERADFDWDSSKLRAASSAPEVDAFSTIWSPLAFFFAVDLCANEGRCGERGAIV
jgi:hypothetical protein